jgi:hypothetical protein
MKDLWPDTLKYCHFAVSSAAHDLLLQSLPRPELGRHALAHHASRREDLSGGSFFYTPEFLKDHQMEAGAR